MTAIEYVNLTPHPVVVHGDDDTVIATIQPSGTVARLAETVAPCDAGTEIPEVFVGLGEIVGLPPRRPEVINIVSMPTLMGHVAGGGTRPDLRYPYGQVCDAGGRIIGCRALADIYATLPVGDPGCGCGGSGRAYGGRCPCTLLADD